MAKMTETEFKKHISSKNFAPLYAIWGDEKKYVKSYTNTLTEKICGKHPSEFNYHEFSHDYDIHQICLAMLTVPFMNKYNVVKITDLNFGDLLKEEKDELFKAIKSIPQGTVVIFTMPTLETNEKKPGDFKKVLTEAEKNGVAVEFIKMGDLALEKHLVTLASRQNVALSAVNADKIISICGNDLTALANEIDKLCAYVGENGEITLKDIELLVTENFEAKVFSLADAVTRGRNDDAIKILDGLFYQREEPIAVLTVLSNAYIDFYRGRIAYECGVSTKSVAEKFNYRNRAFALNRKTSLPTGALRDSISLLIEADTAMKSSGIDNRLILEELVCKLLSIAKKGRSYA